ncbi:hypothetical protein [Microbulbifer sp. 2205BS26-8]|nr:hypothetical protein [Microbulbifer sp. 2205BS26-8]MDP5211315.1 hypothetical protein [Microbulbifer sp. 2205BS26-8]
MSELRKRRERIMAEDIPPKAKQLKLDVIQKGIDAAAVKASQKSGADF